MYSGEKLVGQGNSGVSYANVVLAWVNGSNEAEFGDPGRNTRIKTVGSIHIEGGSVLLGSTANGDVYLQRNSTASAAAGTTFVAGQGSDHASGVGGNVAIYGGPGASGTGQVLLGANEITVWQTTPAGNLRVDKTDPTTHPASGVEEWSASGGYAQRTAGKLTRAHSDLTAGTGSPSSSALVCDYTYHRKSRTTAAGTYYETWEVGTIRGITYLANHHTTIRVDVSLIVQVTDVNSPYLAVQYGSWDRSRSYQYDYILGTIADIVTGAVVDLGTNDPGLAFASSTDAHSVRTSVIHPTDSGGLAYTVDWYYETRVRIWAPLGA
jgi:hypothetical protein